MYTRAAHVLTVNIGAAEATDRSAARRTGLHKRPVEHAVQVAAPGPRGPGGSGLAGDTVCDRRHHGGDDQAVYAFAREDLDRWAAELGRDLPSGCFGENLTTAGLDVSAAVVGERWRVGETLVLEVSDPRIPCRTFAGAMGEPGWVKRFTERAAPGTYLRVLEPGPVRAGDPIVRLSRPDHGVSVALAFRAMTTAPELLPRLVGATGLSAEARSMAARRTQLVLDDA